MPPFSSDIGHQRQHHCIANDGNGTTTNATSITCGPVAQRLTAEAKAYIGREKIHEEDFALGASGRVSKYPIPEANRHFWYHHYSQFEGRGEEKDGTEANDDYDLNSIGQTLDTIKLDIESVLDEFEDNPLYERNGEYSCQEFSYNCIHSQPAPFLPDSTTTTVINRSLFTIPEQRVSFAAKAFGGFVLDDVQVKVIPHVNEYTSEDKQSMWYTRTELRAMRKSCFRTAKVVSRDAELYCPYFIRGLEHLVEQYRHHYDESEKNKSSNDGDDSNTGLENEIASTSESRRRDAVGAVLSEQERQRKLSLKFNNTTYSGSTNLEQIRSVYMIKGGIATSQAIAHTKALKDEACAKEWLMETTPTALSQHNAHDHEYHYKEDRVDCHESDPNNMRLSKNVQRVFHKVLSPFLELREGDIFIELGDEYFLAHT